MHYDCHKKSGSMMAAWSFAGNALSRGRRAANKRHELSVLGLVLLICLAVIPTISEARQSFVVTNGNDSGPGSLRDAIEDAESAPAGNQTITFAPEVQLVQLTTGSIEISTPGTYSISAAFASGLVIDALQSTRIFSVTDPGVELNLSGLTLRNGRTVANAPATATCAPGSGHGGAVCTLGTLSLFGVGFADNQTLGDGAHGGAVYAAQAIQLTNTCPISSLACRFTGNSTEGAGANGGAIYSEAELVFPALASQVNYRFDANRAEAGNGGAIHAPSIQVEPFSGLGPRDPVRFVDNFADQGGALAIDCLAQDPISVIQDVRFEQNSARAGGGAIRAERFCEMDIRTSRFADNACQGGAGGAVFSDGVVAFGQTLLENNRCDGFGGAIAGNDFRLETGNVIRENFTVGNGNHGGAIAARSLLMRDSMAAFNWTEGTAANGGGVWVFETLDIGNSTISNNSTLGERSGGGALFFSGASQDLDLRSSTLFQNSAERGGGILVAGDPPGSLVELDINSTILTRNQPDSLHEEDLGASSQINVIQSVFGDAASEISGSNIANLFTNDPEIGELEDNGCALPAGISRGSVACPLSHAPEPSAVVVDAGNNPAGFSNDQRGVGYPRTFGLQTDIGAIEWNPDPSLRIDPNLVDFGVLVDGDPLPAARPLIVHNDGPGVLNLTGRTVPAGIAFGFGKCESASPLNAGASCAATVRPVSVSFGSIERVIEVESNDPSSPTPITIRYFGTTGAELSLDRTVVDFGEQPAGTTSSTEPLTLTNTGSQPLEIDAISAPPGAFDLAGSSCGSSLAAGASCAIELTFLPPQAGLYSGSLLIVSNSSVPGTSTEVSLSGTSGVIFSDGFEG